MEKELSGLRIDGITHDGMGVARHRGIAVFIDGALPGELVDAVLVSAAKSFMRAKLTEVLERSPMRAEPFCPHYGQCGGCNLQHVSYEGQLALKRRIVEDAFSRIARMKDVHASPVLGMQDPFGYRNKAEYRIWAMPDGSAGCGFRMRGSHDAVDLSECRVVPERSFTMSEALKDELNGLSAGLLPGIRHAVVRVNPEGGSMLVLVSSEPVSPAHRRLAERLMGRVEGLAGVHHCYNRSRYGEVLGGELGKLAGEDELSFTIADNAFKASPSSFLQVNDRQAEALYGLVASKAAPGPQSRVLDLYSGMGTIALKLARSAGAVLGIELNPDAVENAIEAASSNGIGNAVFAAGDAGGSVTSERMSAFKPDILVLDPPRSGCGQGVIEAIAASAAGKVVYVSCDPATLARDVALFAVSGFTVVSVDPVDMFPFTSHVETVVSMSRA